MEQDIKELVEELKSLREWQEQQVRQIPEKPMYTLKEISILAGFSGHNRHFTDSLRRAGYLKNPVFRRPLMYPHYQVAKICELIRTGRMKARDLDK